MSGYTHGIPVWHQIPATSIPRAQAFYTTLFNFQFRNPTPDADSSSESEEAIAHFTYPHPVLGEQLMIGGGIKKIGEGQKIVNNLFKKDTGAVAPIMYFFVDDIEKTMEKAKEMGGVVLVERTKEGETGEYVVLQDCEGNAVGAYACLEK